MPGHSKPSGRELYEVLAGAGTQAASEKQPPSRAAYSPPSFEDVAQQPGAYGTGQGIPSVLIDPNNPPVGFYAEPGVSHENVDEKSVQQLSAWNRFTGNIRNTSPKRWIAAGATVITLAGVVGAAVTPRGKDTLNDIGAFFSAQSLNTKKEFIPLPAPDCLNIAFTAKTDVLADLVVKKTIIDNEKDPAGTLAARAKAAKDPKYVPPKELTKTRFFDDAKSIGIVEAQQLPETFFFGSDGKTTDIKDINYVNRLPVGQLTGEIPFALCLESGAIMKEATTQHSKNHITVDTSKFKISALETDKVSRGYEVYPPTIAKGQTESLVSFKESQRIFKLLAPQGKYDAKTNTYTVGNARNETINDQLKLTALGAISSGEYGTLLQKAARNGFSTLYSDVLGSNVKVDFEGAFKTPKAVMADAINAQPETSEPLAKFINPEVKEFTPDNVKVTPS